MAGAYRATMPRRGRGQGHADAQHNLRLMRDKFVHSGVLFGSSTARGAFRSRRFALLPREKKLAPELAPDNAERAGKRSDLGGFASAIFAENRAKRDAERRSGTAVTRPSATCILRIIATPTTRSSTPIIG